MVKGAAFREKKDMAWKTLKEVFRYKLPNSESLTGDFFRRPLKIKQKLITLNELDL